MKPSKYNHFVPVDGKLYAFNCLTEKFFPVPPGREETYRELLENPDLYEKDFATFYDKMLPGGFILADDTDEMALVREKYRFKCKPENYSLMIMPTYSCNLRCWYCIQNHENVSLPDEYFERIKRLFDKVVKREDIQTVTIWWFGGEPMMKYEKVLDLNLYVKRISEENGKIFSANITTNSTLLTPQRVDSLRESGVNHYQISIDGPKRLHDKVKVLSSHSAFEHALSIIDYIAKSTPVTLRFNFTKESMVPDEVFNDVDSRLSLESRKNIRFHIYKVWQEDAESIDPSLPEQLYRLCKQHQLHPCFQSKDLCYSERVNYMCLLPNGKLDKCDHNGLEYGCGEITKEGDLVWPNTTGHERSILDIKNSECQTCSYLPHCWGPCAAKRQLLLSNEQLFNCEFGRNKEERNRNSMTNLLRSIVESIEQ